MPEFAPEFSRYALILTIALPTPQFAAAVKLIPGKVFSWLKA